MLRPALTSLLTLWLSTASTSAQVSTADKAAAEMLFDRGLGLMKEQKFKEACAELERSQAIEAGIGTMLYLADCYERVGRTASAWAMFREAASTAKARGQVDRAEMGAQRAKQLEPRLTSLSVHVARPVQGLQVLRNGQPLPASLFGVAVPVDPGEQRIQARADGYASWSATVHLKGDGTHGHVDLPVLRALPPQAQSMQPQTPRPQQREAAALQPARSSPFRDVLALTLGGVGLVGIGIGGYLGARAIWKNNAADARCPGGVCTDSQGLAFDDAARSAAQLSTLFWIGGAAFALSGVALYFTGASQEYAPEVALKTRPGGLEISLEGAL